MLPNDVMPNELEDFLKKNNALQHKTQMRTLSNYAMDVALEMLQSRDTFVDYLRTVEASKATDFPAVWKIAQEMSGVAYWNLWVEWAYTGGELFSDEERRLCKNMRDLWLESPRTLSTEEFFVSLFVRKIIGSAK